MGGLPVNIDILLFGNDNLSVEINTFIFSCVQKYIKDTRRFSWTNKSTCITLLTIVNIVYFYMYAYSFLGPTWGIDWLTCHKSMKYTCVINRAHLKRQFLNTWCMWVAYLDRITIRHSLYVGIWDLAYLGKYSLNWITHVYFIDLWHVNRV
jgi:hypothetical protein